jgi:predicted alpha/beta-fold hydrolase
MPFIDTSSYRPPLLFENGHIQTIFPSLFRKVKGVKYRRERIATPDGDFLDLDCSPVGADRAAIVAHGLEGSSQRNYVLGMVRALNRCGWDAIAWNFRGCSGEPNQKLRFYHSGDTDDLAAVVDHVVQAGDRRYRQLALIGFSMGGNMVLKYLGERGETVSDKIQAAVAFSVPCDLTSSGIKMALPSNGIYMRRFLQMLHLKVRAKMELFPGEIDDEGFQRIRTFRDFDDRYTAPLHGFESAEDYWLKASSKPFLEKIAVRTLLVNALNDPFLNAPCFPYEEARSSSRFFLETPASGGHVGFISFNNNGEYWSESRAMEFLDNLR